MSFILRKAPGTPDTSSTIGPGSDFVGKFDDLMSLNDRLEELYVNHLTQGDTITDSVPYVGMTVEMVSGKTLHYRSWEV